MRAVLAVFLAVVVAVAVAFLLVGAAGRGTDTRRAIRECHARGPEFHYWQDRSRCVRYVP